MTHICGTKNAKYQPQVTLTIIPRIKEKHSQFSFNKYVYRREFELIFATEPTIGFVIDAHPNSAELRER